MAIQKKIAYQKPEALDLGAVAPVVGASCANGNNFETNNTCWDTGNNASWICNTGNSASGPAPGFNCSTGNSPL